MNTREHVLSVQKMGFFAYVPRGGIAALYGNCSSSFLGEPPHCFPQWLYQLILPPAVSKDASFTTSSPTCVCHALAILTRVRWCLNIVLICMTLVANDGKCFFFLNMFAYPCGILLLRIPCSGLQTIYFIFLCVGILPACVFVHHMCAWNLQRPEEGTRSPGAGIKESGELAYGYWELNLDPLEEQPVVLTRHRYKPHFWLGCLFS